MQSISIDTFYAQVVADPALFQRLSAGALNSDQLLRRAVAEANKQGYTFSDEEIGQWIARRNAEVGEVVLVPEELSDEQLEVVAGGKIDMRNVTVGPPYP